jgi:hypothetical protein
LAKILLRGETGEFTAMGIVKMLDQARAPGNLGLNFPALDPTFQGV